MLCTATQQKNGHRSEEEAEKPEQSAAEKVLMEDKSQLEEQLKDMTVSLQTGPLPVCRVEQAERVTTSLILILILQ